MYNLHNIFCILRDSHNKNPLLIKCLRNFCNENYKTNSPVPSKTTSVIPLRHLEIKLQSLQIIIALKGFIHKYES